MKIYLDKPIKEDTFLDLSFTWDDQFKVYWCNPVTESGKQYCKRLLKVVRRFSVTKSNFQRTYDNMLECGLTVAVIDSI
jgi:hypothetical protein